MLFRASRILKNQRSPQVLTKLVTTEAYTALVATQNGAAPWECLMVFYKLSINLSCDSATLLNVIYTSEIKKSIFTLKKK